MVLELLNKQDIIRILFNFCNLKKEKKKKKKKLKTQNINKKIVQATTSFTKVKL